MEPISLQNLLRIFVKQESKLRKKKRMSQLLGFHHSYYSQAMQGRDGKGFTVEHLDNYAKNSKIPLSKLLSQLYEIADQVERGKMPDAVIDLPGHGSSVSGELAADVQQQLNEQKKKRKRTRKKLSDERRSPLPEERPGHPSR